MVQDERGLESRCICPICFATCAACMGTPAAPKTAEALREELLRRARFDRGDGRAWGGPGSGG